MIDLNIVRLLQAYREGATTPADVVRQVIERAQAYSDHNIWITAPDIAWMAPYLERLDKLDPDDHPLWGIPFAIKDNIDLAGVDTTAACEAFRYRAQTSAFVVDRLVAAGAIPVGKTNLDQFATGLVGTRSPWGACRNAFDPQMISGGSSAGSAVAVALGMASFSLGTDTAGSGRVPAAFNNLVGLKPTRGLLSSTGMLPACRSLDCMSIFALTTDAAETVLQVAEGEDGDDSYSRSNPFDNNSRHYGQWDDRVVVGVVREEQLQFFGDRAYAGAYAETLSQLRALGWELREIDFTPFLETAKLLYEGPWVAERYLATLPLIEEQPGSLHPTTRAIISAGSVPKATDLFTAEYRLEALRKQCHAILGEVTCLLTPTAGRHYSIDEVEAEPIALNSNLGFYTNFMNLLDLAAVAVPGCFTGSDRPFGVTLLQSAFSDRKLLSIANRLQQHLDLSPGATGFALPCSGAQPVKETGWIDVVVCGAHMEGLPLNWQLVERGARLVERSHTAACYRLYALPGGPPLRPGLVRDDDRGVAIEAEIWRLPASDFGSFTAGIPEPLGIGKVMMADGNSYSGFICEPRGILGAEEISATGGWRAWLEKQG